MKKNVTVMFGIIGLYLFTLMISSCNKGPVEITDQIKDANKVFMDAVSNADTNTLIGLYTADAKIFPAEGAIIDGQAAIGKFWVATLGMGIKKVMFETVIAQKFGDIAIEEGNYALFVEGDHMVDQGKYIVNWKLENGKWKVFRDIWNANTPPPRTRASANDTVLVVMNFVKPDKVSQFEDFNKNYLLPAGIEFNAQVTQTVRMQKPVGQNKDGTYTYVYFMDPFVSSYNYGILHTLRAKYSEEASQKYMKMYIECLKDGNSKPYLLIETDW
ncbi:MAG: DUF4440 domain-containing protein [Bacteroidales bacterium]|nr:DUF4440 domain-containing protein [Bacteroidales bacterium]